MDATVIERALARIAHEIVERNPHSDEIVFIGIRTHDALLAQRLAGKVGQPSKRELAVGVTGPLFSSQGLR